MNNKHRERVRAAINRIKPQSLNGFMIREINQLERERSVLRKPFECQEKRNVCLDSDWQGGWCPL
jgi:hypothetical protein